MRFVVTNLRAEGGGAFSKPKWLDVMKGTPELGDAP